MTDIFISYASEDRLRVRPLVDALQQQHGWTVWWDRTIRAGKIFDRVIEAALKDARCVIVLWSQDSIESDWVRSEAHEAKRRGVLVPALLDDVDVPLAFKTIQAANLVGWSGELPHAQFDELAAAVSDVLSTSAPSAPHVTTPAAHRAAAAAAATSEGELTAAEFERQRLDEERKQAAEKARLEQEERERLAAERDRQEQEEQQQLAAAEKARLEQEERERQAAAEKARLEQEEGERQAAAEKARLEQEERERQAAAEKARLEREERERQAAAEKARLDQEERERQAAAKKARREEEKRKHRAAAEKARLEQEERERQAAAEKARLEQEKREPQAAAEEALPEQKEAPEPATPRGGLLRVAPAMVVIFAVAWLTKVTVGLAASSYLQPRWEVPVYVSAGAVLAYFAGILIRRIRSLTQRMTKLLMCIGWALGWTLAGFGMTDIASAAVGAAFLLIGMNSLQEVGRWTLRR